MGPMPLRVPCLSDLNRESLEVLELNVEKCRYVGTVVNSL